MPRGETKSGGDKFLLRVALRGMELLPMTYLTLNMACSYFTVQEPKAHRVRTLLSVPDLIQPKPGPGNPDMSSSTSSGTSNQSQLHR